MSREALPPSPAPPVSKRGREAAHVEEDSDDGSGTVEDASPQLDDSEPDVKRPRNEGDVATAQSQMQPAECGVIESVELVNFMCHKYLHVNFGPQINFIIGDNGSGKSVVLTAITVALGARAQATNRASSMKGLIRQGETAAEVTLKLKNKGPDAYRGDVYGDCITIVRHIAKDGVSSYKLKSDAGRVISVKKEELVAICDHMGLQPDNPMLILGQDAAREFLTSSTPEERYKMFLRGTELQRLSDDYKMVENNIEKLQVAAEKKTESLKDFRLKRDRAKKRLQQMQAAVNLDATISNLKKEMAWSQVYDLERDRDKLAQKVNAQQEAVDQEEEKFLDLESQLVAARLEKTQLETDCNSLQDESAPLVNSYNDKQAEIAQLAQTVLMHKRDRVEVTEKIKHLRAEEANFNKRIAEQAAKDTSDTALKAISESEDRLLKMTGQLEDMQLQINAKAEELTRIESASAADRCKMEIRECERRKKELEHRIQTVQHDLRRVREAGSDRFRMFGDRVPDMLRYIDQLHRENKFYVGKPVGPIGAFIQLRSGNRWATAIDAVLGANSLYAFIVQDSRDVRTMTRVYEQFKYGRQGRNGQLQGLYDVFCNRLDPNFNFSGGEPDSNDARWTTIVRELKIDEPLVLQVLVTNNNIESTILVEQRTIGEQVMREPWPRNVSACFDSRANKIGNRGGGQANFNLAKQGGNTAGIANLCGKDQSGLLRELQQTMDASEQELIRVNQDLAAKEAEFRHHEQALDGVRSEHRRLVNSRATLVRDCKQLKEEIDDLKFSVTTTRLDDLQQELANVMNEMAANKAQIPGMVETQRMLNTQHAALEAELAVIKQQMAEASAKVDAVKVTLAKCNGKITTLIVKQNEAAQKKTDARRLLFQAQEALTEAIRRFDEGTRAALDFCDGARVEKDDLSSRDSAKLGARLAALMESLKARENELGSLEDAVAACQDAQEKFDNLNKDIEGTLALSKQLKLSVARRYKSWEHFRQHISLSASIMFVQMLQHRGYMGALKFQHHPINKLHLHVETEDAAAASQVVQDNNTQSTQRRKRDPRGLSGGEKSFSTVCLLLALWDAMATSIRALDEFDVFMDSVNRHMATSLIITAARSSPRNQFILITPQSMDRIASGPDIRVIRMSDPERQWRGGQTRLNFPVAGATR